MDDMIGGALGWARRVRLMDGSFVMESEGGR